MATPMPTATHRPRRRPSRPHDKLEIPVSERAQPPGGGAGTGFQEIRRQWRREDLRVRAGVDLGQRRPARHGGGAQNYDPGGGCRRGRVHRPPGIHRAEYVRRGHEEVLENLKDAFKVFDIDKNGYITAEELQDVLQSLGEECTLAECEKMISGVDSDGSGTINFDEFKVMMMKGFRYDTTEPAT
ncbi:UNVERIFIED_CONTAM: putative calcium-binding protein CML25 [Sesamum calycinum]|uniref:Calcium-binding protein CML25 n=1 Tax=Sesamum calycinum TaxID=2727403 RepID=A0AAW2QXR8_9LAMI